ncbi:MAG TPA: cytochrome C oxidase subunit IV family protein [Chloroflexota bacterium]|nr:cytochrome C oxidase subunit IV family protein [Chloroflexota bacterium]
MTDHVVAVRLYVLVTVGLLVLTGVTVAVAHVNLGWLNAPLALLIAAGKAVLIALFFMHLRWGDAQVRLVALAGVLWVSILIIGTMDDILTRGWLPIPGK